MDNKTPESVPENIVIDDEPITQQSKTEDAAQANMFNPDLIQMMSQQLAQSLSQNKGNKKESYIPTQRDLPDEEINLDTKVDFYQALTLLSKYGIHKTTYCDQPMIGNGIPELKQGMNGPFINVQMGYIAPYKSAKYTVCTKNVAIEHYFGKMRVRDLEVHPVFDMDELEPLVERGVRMQQITQKPTFMHANGHMYVPTQWGGMKRLPIDSRVIVDPEGYNKWANADRWYNSETHPNVPDDMLHSTLPTVPVYSLEYRMWGEVPIIEIGEIVFDETAYNRAIIPDDYRSMIHDLVINFYGTSCSDFIAGRKKGLVFLLNGPPGVGKTLTAHAIAELAHRPLYTVGAGDLGTQASHIETELKQIFDMVEHWNGVVLIDETDVFMSKRIDYDIPYNACVSIFLRLVEQYMGILFLTSNRGNNIDPAFDSRIHVRLPYRELVGSERAQVWMETLNRYSIFDIDVNSLNLHDLNNREIANTVQLAYVQVGGDPTKVTNQLLEKYVKLREDFNK